MTDERAMPGVEDEEQEVLFVVDSVVATIVVARMESGVKVGEYEFTGLKLFHPLDRNLGRVLGQAEAQARKHWESTGQ